MTSPIWSQSDFTAGLLALLPRGRLWPRDPDAFLPAVFDALSPSLLRVNIAADGLLTDGFPATTVELLPDWEAVLGLPDPCAGDQPTLQQRQSQVLARFSDSGGQSVAYFTAFAATLGTGITVTEYMPFRAGLSAAGAPCASEEWAFVWQVASDQATVTHFVAGASTAGDALNVYSGIAVLECELRARAPAHTLPIFAAAPPSLDFNVSTNSEFDQIAQGV